MTVTPMQYLVLAFIVHVSIFVACVNTPESTRFGVVRCFKMDHDGDSYPQSQLRVAVNSYEWRLSVS